MTTSLTTADGEVIAAATGQRPSTAAVRPSGGHGFTAHLPLQAVPPGRYLLRVDARSDAGSGATASRVIPLVVR